MCASSRSLSARRPGTIATARPAARSFSATKTIRRRRATSSLAGPFRRRRSHEARRSGRLDRLRGSVLAVIPVLVEVEGTSRRVGCQIFVAGGSLVERLRADAHSAPWWQPAACTREVALCCVVEWEVREGRGAPPSSWLCKESSASSKDIDRRTPLMFPPKLKDRKIGA